MSNRKVFRDLNRLPGYEDRRYFLGHYIADQIKAANMSLETLDALGLIAKAGQVDIDAYIRVKSLKSLKDGGGGGGYTQAQIPPHVYTPVSISVLQKINQFLEIPLTIWTIIALRRLFNDPVDVMLGLEYLPVIYGGSKIIKNTRRIKQKELTKLTNSNHATIYKVDSFSEWAYDNKAGKIETPAEWILEQLEKYRFGWDILIKMRNILEANLDDLLGMCYNDM